MTDTIKHFERQTSSTLCSVLFLVHPKNQVPYFILNKVVTDSNLTHLLLRKKTNKQTKTKQNKQTKKFKKCIKVRSSNLSQALKHGIFLALYTFSSSITSLVLYKLDSTTATCLIDSSICVYCTEAYTYQAWVSESLLNKVSGEETDTPNGTHDDQDSEVLKVRNISLTYFLSPAFFYFVLFLLLFFLVTFAIFCSLSYYFSCFHLPFFLFCFLFFSFTYIVALVIVKLEFTNFIWANLLKITLLGSCKFIIYHCHTFAVALPIFPLKQHDWLSYMSGIKLCNK